MSSSLTSNAIPRKAVGLLSGGLDSALAARIIHALGFEIHAIYFSQPWGCCNKIKAMETAEKLGIKFVALQLDERYLEVIKKPKHGYGSVLNPCVDCRIHMFSRAKKYMVSIGADFVFTGEVLGQRPMSQMRRSLSAIEKESDLEGRLLRPLCAKLLDPTIPEKEGIIDREKLLDLSGRSRNQQISMAKEFGISDYLPPAGGCLLTDKNFSRRMKDSFQYGYRNFRETIALKWGRHFRIAKDFKAVLGRDEEENTSLKAFAHPEDFIFELPDKRGPTLVLKGSSPSDEILQMCAGLVQKFSRYKDTDSVLVEYWPALYRHGTGQARDTNQISQIYSRKITDAEIEQILI